MDLFTNVRRTGRVVLAFAAAAAGSCVVFAACTRHADIRDEPDSSFVKPTPQIDTGDIPELDSGIGTDAYPACGDRPAGDCQGPVDFPCDFEGWVGITAANCQQATGCKTNGSLEVGLGEDGCVAQIGMDQPNDDIVKCLVEAFGAVHCPCGTTSVTHFFGKSNPGVCP